MDGFRGQLSERVTRANIILHINSFCLVILSITTIYYLFSLSNITIYSFYQRITNYLVIDLSLINPFVDIMILMVGNVIMIQLSQISKAIKLVILSSIFFSAVLLYFQFYPFTANIQVTIFIGACLTIIYSDIIE